MEDDREEVAALFEVALEVVARPFEELFDAERGADLADEPRPLDEEDRLLEAEAERPDEAEVRLPVEEDFEDADFLLSAELKLRLPEDEPLFEERPDARPEDWLRDFFIDV